MALQTLIWALIHHLTCFERGRFVIFVVIAFPWLILIPTKFFLIQDATTIALVP